MNEMMNFMLCEFYINKKQKIGVILLEASKAATRHSHTCLGLWSARPPLLRDLLAACIAFLQISCSFTLLG